MAAAPWPRTRTAEDRMKLITTIERTGDLAAFNNPVQHNGRTIMVVAALKGDIPAIDRLYAIDKGLMLRLVPNGNNSTPLVHAIAAGIIATVEWFGKMYENAYGPNVQGITAMHAVAMAEQLAVLHYLITKAPSSLGYLEAKYDGCTPIALYLRRQADSGTYSTTFVESLADANKLQPAILRIPDRDGRIPLEIYLLRYPPLHQNETVARLLDPEIPSGQKQPLQPGAAAARRLAAQPPTINFEMLDGPGNGAGFDDCC